LISIFFKFYYEFVYHSTNTKFVLFSSFNIQITSARTEHPGFKANSLTNNNGGIVARISSCTEHFKDFTKELRYPLTDDISGPSIYTNGSNELWDRSVPLNLLRSIAGQRAGGGWWAVGVAIG